ncbi:DUF2690 domain-containing protein [Brevibacterium album]|uniref:DUF2690 domain-containing protein n=1 Tax=Brevibacterium album TaxID=417948 RepID=UPI000491B93F|nr:DUF2690 domain-containing protein [Brevibacterium album]
MTDAGGVQARREGVAVAGGSGTAQDTPERFAADLRALRAAAGQPTLMALSGRTEGKASKTTLSDALRGRKKPSEHTVRCLVAALGGDEDEWVTRWWALYGQESAAEADSSAPPEPASGTEAVPAQGGSSGGSAPAGGGPSPASGRGSGAVIPRWLAAVIAGGAALVTAGATSLLWANVIAPGYDDFSPRSSVVKDYVDFADGVDPMRTVCREDAIIASAENRMDGEFLVEMMYSSQCMAVWGRVTRYDGKAIGNSLEMYVYPAIDMGSPRSQQRQSLNVNSLYTPLVIEPDVEARVCGIAEATVEGEVIELGPALCI